ncbi:RES family NAD+ phosphorylase [Novispirillum sp. DQ9]|uniref:RES family NAD+ phosphorylase n=1 Tax=Novispirillum sp. DQ9 TaxID=3398612 RepID=UPI003C7EC4CD
MEGAGPPAAFANLPLQIEVIPAGQQFYRIIENIHTDPLGFGRTTSSRFSAPRPAEGGHVPFGVVYLAAELDACFIETVIRDRGDGRSEKHLLLDVEELRRRDRVSVQVASALSLISLVGVDRHLMGVPTDVTGARSHTLSQLWSVAFHDHPSKPDGVLYPSRLQPALTNVALYDRALSKLGIVDRVPLLDCRADIARIVKTYRIALI